MSKKPKELTEIQKKRMERVDEIIKGYKENRKEHNEVVTKTLNDIKKPFDDIVDTILFNCDEMERAKVAQALVESFMTRMTFKGYVIAGVVEYIKQRLVVQPLVFDRLLQGRRIVNDAVANIREQKGKEDTKYIR